MGIPVMIERWVPHELGVRWVIAWERYKILTYKTHDEAVAAARRLGYEITNESPCRHTEGRAMSEYTCPSCVEGDHRNCTRLTCICVCDDERETMHFVSASCRGEHCSMCREPATHKVGEEILHDDPMPDRHNLTAYVCCKDFTRIVGPVATLACRT